MTDKSGRKEQEKRKKIVKTYDILYKAYGPQGWWPLTPDGEVQTRHHAGKPKHDLHRFEIMLGAILTQNTAWINVEKALMQLHKNRCATPEKIILKKKEKLAEHIRSAGYYNQKSERLKIIAKFTRDQGIGNLIKTETKDLREMLLSIKGIGPETADSIILYAFEKPTFVIDTYTKRIFSRLGVCKPDADYHDIQAMFMETLKPDVEKYQEYHALIVELAKRHCKTKPECAGCPLGSLCERSANAFVYK